jgi:hypothetical protein
MFWIFFFLIEFAVMVFYRAVYRIGSGREPRTYARFHFLASGLLIQLFFRPFYDGVFESDFGMGAYFVLRVVLSVVAYYFFRGSREYQSDIWKEYISIAREHAFDAHMHNLYYYGYHDGYYAALDEETEGRYKLDKGSLDLYKERPPKGPNFLN